MEEAGFVFSSFHFLPNFGPNLAVEAYDLIFLFRF